MKKYLLPAALSLIFFISQILTISDYGVNWDAPFRMMRGQAFLHFFLTGEKSYGFPDRISPILITSDEFASRHIYNAGELGPNFVNLPPRPLIRAEFENQKDSIGKASFYQHEAWNGEYFISDDDPGHPPLPDILAALSNRILYQNLGLLGDIESHQVFYLLVASFGVFIVSLFAFEITRSLVTAAAAGLAIALFPLYLGDSHINMKDPLQAVFFTSSIWAFWHWVRENKLRWPVLFVASVTLAVSIKWNVIFLPFILLPWLFLIRKTEEFKKWFKPKKLIIYSFLGTVIIFSFLILIWPYLWTDPLGKILDVFGFYWDIGTGSGSIQPPGFMLPLGFNSYSAVLLLTQTPELILLLTALAIFKIIKHRKTDSLKVGYLLILWLVVSAFRETLPGVRLYGGVRQFMEVVPVLAILSGLGASYLTTYLNLKFPKWKKFTSLTLLSLITYHLSLINVRYHPNQNAYFNTLAGGLEGAYQKNLIDWTLTYGNIYKQGVIWLNENAPKNANLAHLDGPSFSISPLYLRPDISLSPSHFSGFESAGEYIMAIYNPLNPPIFAHRYPQRFLKPVHEVMVDRVPLLTIFKNDPKNTSSDVKNQKNLEKLQIKSVQSPEGDYWEIDLGKNYKVTQITISDAPPNCLSYDLDLVGFIPDEKRYIPMNIKDFYSLNERRKLDDGKIEFLYPAEVARYIVAFPRSPNSCLVSGKITSIKYIP